MSDTETVPDDTDTDSTESGAMRGPTEHDPIDVYHHQRHRNGDETVVLVTSFGGGYQALAFDVDAGGQLLEVEEIGDSPDEQKATGMVEYWLDQHPNGVWGGDGGGAGGFLSKMSAMFGGGD